MLHIRSILCRAVFVKLIDLVYLALRYYNIALAYLKLDLPQSQGALRKALLLAEQVPPGETGQLPSSRAPDLQAGNAPAL